MKKRYTGVAALLCMAALLAGCSSTQEQMESGEAPALSAGGSSAAGEQQMTAAEYMQAIADYFNMDDRVKIYNGYAEYGHQLVFLAKTEGPERILISYHGEMSDGLGSDSGGSRSFTATYSVESGSVTEQVSNEDPLKKREDVLNSILPGFIVLKGEIETANAWKQTFMSNGKQYTAVTTIVDASQDGFTTETVARNMPGYPDGTYREVRTYRKGVGLSSFRNTPYSETQDTELLFSYSYSGELDPKTGLLVPPK